MFAICYVDSADGKPLAFLSVCDLSQWIDLNKLVLKCVMWALMNLCIGFVLVVRKGMCLRLSLLLIRSEGGFVV